MVELFHTSAVKWPIALVGGLDLGLGLGLGCGCH